MRLFIISTFKNVLAPFTHVEEFSPSSFPHSRVKGQLVFFSFGNSGSLFTSSLSLISYNVIRTNFYPMFHGSILLYHSKSGSTQGMLKNVVIRLPRHRRNYYMAFFLSPTTIYAEKRGIMIFRYGEYSYLASKLKLPFFKTTKK